MGAAWYAEDTFEEPIDLVYDQFLTVNTTAVASGAAAIGTASVVAEQFVNNIAATIIPPLTGASQMVGATLNTSLVNDVTSLGITQPPLNYGGGFQSISIPASLPLYGSNVSMRSSNVTGYLQDAPPAHIATPTNLPVMIPAIGLRLQQLGQFQLQGMETGIYISQPYLFISLGVVYIGEWLRGKPHGRGQMIFTNGSVFDGYFFRGKTIGIGRFVQPNGDYYQGEFVGLVAQGRGVCVVGNIFYEGEFMQNVPQGTGYETTLDRSIQFIGQYNMGQKVYGKMSWQGFVYNGPFVNGLFNGIGYVRTPQGTFQGNFVDGVMVNGKPLDNSGLYGSGIAFNRPAGVGIGMVSSPAFVAPSPMLAGSRMISGGPVVGAPAILMGSQVSNTPFIGGSNALYNSGVGLGFGRGSMVLGSPVPSYTYSTLPAIGGVGYY